MGRWKRKKRKREQGKGKRERQGKESGEGLISFLVDIHAGEWDRVTLRGESTRENEGTVLCVLCSEPGCRIWCINPDYGFTIVCITIPRISSPIRIIPYIIVSNVGNMFVCLSLFIHIDYICCHDIVLCCVVLCEVFYFMSYYCW
jgi:hypothetical protein